MAATDLRRVARRVVWALRHAPDEAGIVLDREGWAEVRDLCRAMGSHGRALALGDLQAIVEADSKQRMEFSADGRRIRAAQGHSVAVDLSSQRSEPPQHLFHGTSTDRLDSIRRAGLHAARRQHVHLSVDCETAARVGARHGTPVILRIRSEELARAGQVFLLASNGVWLTDSVPADAIDWQDLKYPTRHPE